MEAPWRKEESMKTHETQSLEVGVGKSGRFVERNFYRRKSMLKIDSVSSQDHPKESDFKR